MFPALDYYLTQLENPISRLKDGTILTVHFAKKKSKNLSSSQKGSISKEDFEYLKVIGRGGYSKGNFHILHSKTKFVRIPYSSKLAFFSLINQ